MSRMSLALFPALLCTATSSRAQDADTARIEQMMERQKQMFGVPSRQPRCEPGDGSEIVVCAQDESQFRALSTAEEDPTSDAALDDGLPRAPDFSKRCDPTYIGCITSGWAPPPIYLIDLKAIPEPPPGSDADKIAKGEMRAP